MLFFSCRNQRTTRPHPGACLWRAWVLACSLTVVSMGSVQAQTQTPAAPSGGAADPAAILNGERTEAPEQDAVSRFLNEKGLINTRPVVDAAQQVRDKAVNIASDLVISAMDFLGVPYRRGGDSRETGFDCSGFTRHVFERSLGLMLPRRASEQANMPGMIPVAQTELKPGDLVFFNTLRNTFSHVGIYIGDNKFIHSPRSGTTVRIEDMRISYWQQRFDGARRLPNLAKAGLPASLTNAVRNNSNSTASADPAP